MNILSKEIIKHRYNSILTFGLLIASVAFYDMTKLESIHIITFMSFILFLYFFIRLTIFEVTLNKIEKNYKKVIIYSFSSVLLLFGTIYMICKHLFF